MCSTPSTPSVDTSAKSDPLRILLSRDRFDKIGNSGSQSGYLLPPRGRNGGGGSSGIYTPGGGGLPPRIASGLNASP